MISQDILGLAVRVASVQSWTWVQIPPAFSVSHSCLWHLCSMRTAPALGPALFHQDNLTLFKSRQRLLHTQTLQTSRSLTISLPLLNLRLKHFCGRIIFYNQVIVQMIIYPQLLKCFGLELFCSTQFEVFFILEKVLFCFQRKITPVNIQE